MERNESDCPIHGTEGYRKLSAAWSSYGWRLADPIRDAIEKGGDVQAAIDQARKRLNQLEDVLLGLHAG